MQGYYVVQMRFLKREYNNVLGQAIFDSSFSGNSKPFYYWLMDKSTINELGGLFFGVDTYSNFLTITNVYPYEVFKKGCKTYTNDPTFDFSKVKKFRYNVINQGFTLDEVYEYNGVHENVGSMLSMSKRVFDELIPALNEGRLERVISGGLRGTPTVGSVGDKDGVKFGFEGVEMGLVYNSLAKVSVNGSIAVQNSQGKYVIYRNNSIIDVNALVFENIPLFYIPIGYNKVKKGDIILLNSKPVYVEEVIKKNKKVEKVRVVDYADAEVKTVYPVKNVFGFNYFTKVTSLVKNKGQVDCDEDNPFGDGKSLMIMSLLNNKK